MDTNRRRLYLKSDHLSSRFPRNRRIVDDGLVTWYDFRNDLGTLTLGERIGGLDATITNASANVVWRFGKEQNDYDGVDEYARYVISDYRSSDSTGSIDAWINPLGAPSTIFMSGDESVNNLYLYFYVLSGFIGTGTIAISHNLSGTQNAVRGQTVVTNKGWSHVAVTTNGSAWKIYLNSVEESLSIVTGSNTGDWFDTLTGRDNIVVGGWVGSLNTSEFYGQIHTVRVYSRELSEAEIRQNYQVGRRIR